MQLPNSFAWRPPWGLFLSGLFCRLFLSRLFIVSCKRVTDGARDRGGRGLAAEVRRMQRRVTGDALDRAHEPRGGGVLAEMVEHHDARPEGADRIGDALARDVEARAVDRLEHGGE